MYFHFLVSIDFELCFLPGISSRENKAESDGSQYPESHIVWKRKVFNFTFIANLLYLMVELKKNEIGINYLDCHII